MSRTMMSSTRTLYFLPGAGTVASAWRPHRATALLPLPRGRAGWGRGDTAGWHSLVVPPAQLREVGQLLDADDAVVERGLEALGHGVGQDDGDHDGEDVRDLSRQLEDDDGRGHRVGDSARQRGRPCARARPRETQGQPSGARLPARGAVSRTPGTPLGHPRWQGSPRTPAAPLEHPRAAARCVPSAVLTHHGVAPRHDAVGVAVGVDAVGEPGCHALPHQPPKSCPCPTKRGWRGPWGPDPSPAPKCAVGHPRRGPQGSHR